MQSSDLFYNNNKRANVEDFRESPIVPNILANTKMKSLFYTVNRGSLKNPRNVLIKLESKSLQRGLEEIEKRQLYKKDRSKAPKQKVEKMKFWFNAALKLRDACSLFSWCGFKRITLVNCFNVSDLDFREKEYKIYFNPSWVSRVQEHDIILKLREFIPKI